jgi:F0F1-type ATP synthase delta subunit
MAHQPTRRELVQVIVDLIAQTRDEKKLARDIAQYLMRHKQSGNLDAILRAVMTNRQKTGIVEVSATTAFPLTTSVQKEVTAAISQEYPEAQHVIVHGVVRPEVLSGVDLQTIDKQFNATAQGKLDQLTRAVA